jgi:hypothetical protein
MAGSRCRFNLFHPFNYLFIGKNKHRDSYSKYAPDRLLTKANYPTVAWREMSDIRNKIIHHYFGVDYDIVWDTVKNNIPELKDWIEVIVSNETPINQ